MLQFTSLRLKPTSVYTTWPGASGGISDYLYAGNVAYGGVTRNMRSRVAFTIPSNVGITAIKSITIEVRATAPQYPQGIEATLSATPLSDAYVKNMLDDATGTYIRPGLIRDIAISDAYMDFYGEDPYLGSSQSQRTSYFKFETHKVLPGQTYYIYFNRYQQNFASLCGDTASIYIYIEYTDAPRFTLEIEKILNNDPTNGNFASISIGTDYDGEFLLYNTTSAEILEGDKYYLGYPETDLYYDIAGVTSTAEYVADTYEIEGVMPDHDITFTYSFVTTYRLSYYKNFGDNAQVGNTERYRYDTLITIPTLSSDIQRVGYTFNDTWTTSSNGSGKVCEVGQQYSGLSGSPNGLVQLYAQWVPNTYILTFNANGGKNTPGNNFDLPAPPTGYGEEESWVTVKYDSTNFYAMKHNIPTREGCEFLGWFTEKENGEEIYDKDGEAKRRTSLFTDAQTWCGLSDVTLYAHWKINTQTYLGHTYNDGDSDESIFEWRLVQPYVYSVQVGKWVAVHTHTQTDNDWKPS